MVRLLTTHGVDVNLVIELFLKLPLHTSARYGCDAVAKVLLEHGADPNAESDWGTPLTVAVCCNNISVALMLIRGGSTVTTQSLCQRRCAEHSMMLVRAKLHILAKDFIQVNDGFKRVFLQGVPEQQLLSVHFTTTQMCCTTSLVFSVFQVQQLSTELDMQLS